MRKGLIYLLFIGLCVFYSASTISADSSMNLHLGKPYLVAPLGEGLHDRYAPAPLFRIDGFDCTTYVETILAQHTQIQGFDNLQENLTRIRYMNDEVNFFSRAHLVEYHWIPNALAQNLILAYPIDNTESSNFNINLQEWFLGNPFVQNKDEEYIKESLEQPAFVNASIDYVPREYITEEFVSSLPEFMVVFFIKELPSNSWAGQHEQQKLVTHMGLLRNENLYHASRTLQEVRKENLVEYMQSIPSFVGASFYTVL